jgi:hypothetical protein
MANTRVGARLRSSWAYAHGARRGGITDLGKWSGVKNNQYIFLADWWFDAPLKTLTVQDVIQAQTLSPLELIQQNLLVVQDIEQAQTLDAVTLDYKIKKDKEDNTHPAIAPIRQKGKGKRGMQAGRSEYLAMMYVEKMRQQELDRDDEEVMAVMYA